MCVYDVYSSEPRFHSIKSNTLQQHSPALHSVDTEHLTTQKSLYLLTQTFPQIVSLYLKTWTYFLRIVSLYLKTLTCCLRIVSLYLELPTFISRIVSLYLKAWTCFLKTVSLYLNIQTFFSQMCFFLFCFLIKIQIFFPQIVSLYIKTWTCFLGIYISKFRCFSHNCVSLSQF